MNWGSVWVPSQHSTCGVDEMEVNAVNRIDDLQKPSGVTSGLRLKKSKMKSTTRRIRILIAQAGFTEITEMTPRRRATGTCPERSGDGTMLTRLARSSSLYISLGQRVSPES